MGSFSFRGEAISFNEHDEFVPIGLLQHCRVVEPIAAGERVRWAQVALPDSMALAHFKALQEEK